jgi:hypothetical protein
MPATGPSHFAGTNPLSPDSGMSAPFGFNDDDINFLDAEDNFPASSPDFFNINPDFDSLQNLDQPDQKALLASPAAFNSSTLPGLSPHYSSSSHRDSSSSSSSSGRSARSRSPKQAQNASGDTMMTDDHDMKEWKVDGLALPDEDANYSSMFAGTDGTVNPASMDMFGFNDQLMEQDFDFDSASSSPSPPIQTTQPSLSPEASSCHSSVRSPSNAKRARGHNKATSVS